LHKAHFINYTIILVFLIPALGLISACESQNSEVGPVQRESQDSSVAQVEDGIDESSEPEPRLPETGPEFTRPRDTQPVETPDPNPELVAYYQEGVNYYEAGEYASAFNIFDEVIQLDPDFVQAYGARAAIFYEYGDFEAAISDYSSAIDFEPVYDLYILRGHAYQASDDLENAEADYTSAIEMGNEIPWPYSFRGNIRAELGNADGAIEDYTSAMDLSDEPVYLFYMQRGRVYYATGEYDSAMSDYISAIELNDRVPELHQGLAGTLYMLEDYQGAVNSYTSALELKPDDAFTLVNRGRAYIAMDELSLAEDDLTAALEIDPDDEEARRLLLMTTERS